MTFRDILVHVDNSKQCKARLQVAASLAADHQAHLIAVYVRPVPQVPEFVRAQFGGVIRDLQRDYVSKSEGEAKALFDAAVSAAGLSEHDWRPVDGDLIETMAVHARYVDLTVLGQSDRDEEDRALPDHLVLDAGRPVLVVPNAGSYPKLGERVVVAWNASREATRAVNDAMPLLKRAKKVTVLAVNPDKGRHTHGDVPGADIALHLARHGVKVEAEQVVANDVEVGDMLLSRLADEDADLLVMGAYGRSRMREIVLGGATREILQHMTVPVLMSH